MTRVGFVFLIVAGIGLLTTGSVLGGTELVEEVGQPPVITSPPENAWFALNAPIDYCWVLPGGVVPEDVQGFELQFSNTETPNGPWDAVRYFTATCWHYAAGHQCVWQALYWRVRIVYHNADRSPWAISYHRVGTAAVPTEHISWGRMKALYE